MIRVFSASLKYHFSFLLDHYNTVLVLHHCYTSDQVAHKANGADRVNEVSREFFTLVCVTSERMNTFMYSKQKVAPCSLASRKR